jgi:hypothetical protein
MDYPDVLARRGNAHELVEVPDLVHDQAVTPVFGHEEGIAEGTVASAGAKTGTPWQAAMAAMLFTPGSCRRRPGR